MNRWMLAVIVLLSLSALAPCRPGDCPTPEETQPVETQPVETQPVETQPVETQPVETQPPVFIEVAETPWEPQWLPTKPERERKDAVLPQSGHGPQQTPILETCGSLLLAVLALAWRMAR